MPPIPTNLPVWAVVLLLLAVWIGREGIGAYLKWRAARMQEKLAETEADDKRALGGYRELIGELKGRVTHLEETLSSITDKHEKSLTTLRQEHINCLEAQAEARAKISTLESEVKSLREWRHGIAGQAQAIVANAAADKLGVTPPPHPGPTDAPQWNP